MVTVTGKDPAGSTLRSQTLARFLRIAPGSLVALPADRKPQLTTTAHGSTAPSTRPCRTWMSDYDRREGAATGVSKDYPGFLFSTCLLNPPMPNRHRHCQRRRPHLGFLMMAPDFLCQPAVVDADVEAVADTEQVTVSVDSPGFLLLPCRRGLTGEVAPTLAVSDPNLQALLPCAFFPARVDMRGCALPCAPRCR